VPGMYVGISGFPPTLLSGKMGRGPENVPGTGGLWTCVHPGSL